MKKLRQCRTCKCFYKQRARINGKLCCPFCGYPDGKQSKFTVTALAPGSTPKPMFKMYVIGNPDNNATAQELHTAQERVLDELRKGLDSWTLNCPCTCKGCDALRVALLRGNNIIDSFNIKGKTI
jgi:hypothetical protein